jgi:hypothetical protein
MNFNSHPLFRALELLWRQMGASRIYAVVIATGVLILAALGVVHLVSPAAGPSNQPVSSKPISTEVAAKVATPKAMPSPSPDELVKEPSLTLTEMFPTATRLRDGSTNVIVLIGVTPRANAKKGEVEIRVSFFDVTRDYQLRPTDAQVGYEWITPVRDWTDPTPKYLEASYTRPRPSRRSRERTRYGGFIVRVYLDGKLQDERSEPRELLAASRAARPLVAPPDSAEIAADDLDVGDEEPPAPVVPTPTPEPRVAANPPSPKPTAGVASAAPYGSPVPDKPGFVYSPYNEKFIIDVRGVPPGTEVNDPNTGKPLRVP